MKTFSQEWEIYKTEVLVDALPSEIGSGRLAFYGGATCCLEMVLQSMNKEGEGDFVREIKGNYIDDYTGAKCLRQSRNL